MPTTDSTPSATSPPAMSQALAAAMAAGADPAGEAVAVELENELANDPEIMERLVRLLTVEPDPEAPASDGGPDAFVGRNQRQAWGRVFGGQVLGQSLAAAILTVDADRPVHSLHGYFLRPGDMHQRIHFSVERLRDGRSFSARRVQAAQADGPILSMIVSFQVPSEGLEHSAPMPDVPGPETFPSLIRQFGHLDPKGIRGMVRQRPVDMRHVEGSLYLTPDPERRSQQALWVKTLGPLPDDPALHRAALAYISDFSLLEPVLRRHGLTWSTPGLKPASLDHAMWFHRPARADEWLLYVQDTPSATGARGLGIGRMYTRDGVHVATVAQEGMLRVPAASGPDA